MFPSPSPTLTPGSLKCIGMYMLYLPPGSTTFSPTFIILPHFYTMALNLLSLNAKGLNTPFKRSMLWKEARKYHADVLCVQETHFCQSSPITIHNQNYPLIYLASAEKKKAGVMIAIKITVAFQLIRSHIDPGGRYIILICHINDVICTLVNTYTPNTHQVSFLNKIHRKLCKVRQGRLIWSGDFNGIGDRLMDSTSRSSSPPLQLQTWFTKADLYDMWRCLHATEKDYTFYSQILF